MESTAADANDLKNIVLDILGKYYVSAEKEKVIELTLGE